jgi:hypothetical protein
MSITVNFTRKSPCIPKKIWQSLILLKFYENKSESEDQRIGGSTSLG